MQPRGDACAMAQTEARREPFDTVSFSGSGWLYLYQIGVSAALRDAGVISYTADSPAPITKCVGASGGALVAVATAVDLDTNLMKATALQTYDRMTKDDGMWGCVTEVSPMVRKVLSDLEPHVVAAATAMARRRQKEGGRTPGEGHVSAGDNLPDWLKDGINNYVGVWISTASTSWPFVSSVERRRFASYSDLTESLVASSLDAGRPQALKRSCLQAQLDTEDGWPRFGFTDAMAATLSPHDTVDGPFVFDGGFTRLQPLQFARERHGTIFVSPLWWQFGAQIRPWYLPSLWAVAPPSDRRQYEAVFAFGYRDGIRFATHQGCISHDVAENLLMNHLQCGDPELMALQPSPLTYGIKNAAFGLTLFAVSRSLYRKLRRR